MDKKQINVIINVPDDWETSLGMQPHIEAEIKADRWAWEWREEKKVFMIDQVENLEVDGVDTKDYPDFSDAYFSSGNWISTGKPLTDEELERLSDEYPCVLNAMAYEHYI